MSDIELPDSKKEMDFEDVLQGEMEHEKTQVQKFRNRDVTKDSYKDFQEKITNEIQSVLETISELAKNRRTDMKQLESRKDGIDREDINDQGLDDLEVSELRKSLADNAERRVEKWVYAFFLQRIRASKFKQVLDSIDDKKVQTEFMKRHRQLLREERQTFENKLQNVTANLEVLAKAFREEQRQNRKVLENTLEEIGANNDLQVEEPEDDFVDQGNAKEDVLNKLKQKHKGEIDLSQEEIAEECGVTQSRVSAIKNGTNFQEWLEAQ